MGFKNSFLNVLFNPVGIFEEAGKGVSKAVGGNNAPSAPLPMPEAPKVEAVTDKADETIRRRRSALSQTVYTSPLGLGGEAAVAKKTLLGQ